MMNRNNRGGHGHGHVGAQQRGPPGPWTTWICTPELMFVQLKFDSEADKRHYMRLHCEMSDLNHQVWEAWNAGDEKMARYLQGLWLELAKRLHAFFGDDCIVPHDREAINSAEGMLGEPMTVFRRTGFTFFHHPPI